MSDVKETNPNMGFSALSQSGLKQDTAPRTAVKLLPACHKYKT